MKYFKNLSGTYIDSVSTGEGEIEITESEYIEILGVIQTATAAPKGYAYLLRADNLEWELVELPEEDDPEDEELSDSEALDIILGGAE